MEEQVTSYRDLRVWQESMALAREVYEVSSAMPTEERYGLTQQIRRSVVSIASNIAEGHARDTTPDYLRHLSIARGSLAELETQLLLSIDLGQLEKTRVGPCLQQCDTVSRMLRGLQRSLRARS